MLYTTISYLSLSDVFPMPALKSLAAVTACLLALVAASPVEKRATCYKGPYVIYARGES